MTVRERVRGTQRLLVLLLTASAALWAAAVFVALSVVNQRLAAGASLVTFAAVVWFDRFAWSLDRVALWIEERAPHLRYALVTAADKRFTGSLDRSVLLLLPSARVNRHLGKAAFRALLPPAVVLVVAVIAASALPTADRAVIVPPPAGASVVVPGNRLVPLSARVIPPRYSRLPTTTLREPSTITALQGSTVELRGREGWQQSVVVRDTAPELLQLSDRGYSRTIIIDPKVDQAPRVTLRAPARDTTLRVVGGTLHLAADLSDDIGLDRAHFEFIVSSGSGESFTFREGTLAERRLGGETKAQLEHRVSFASFDLKEGDRLSVRAVAWDNNTFSGPGRGTSETRIIRVATKDEYDTLAVNRAPASADTAMMSLRMLILATEKLRAERRSMERQAFLRESNKLAGQGETIRRRIQQIVEETTGGGQIAADTLLTTALGAMWDATRELRIASPEGALPPMYVAYRALQALRNTNRYYIRGLLQPIVVNVERVRLTGGTDTGTATPRAPRGVEQSVHETLRAGYSHAVQLLTASPSQGDSAMTVLMTMRVASLRPAPAVAAAVGDAIAALQNGTDVTPALLRTRRLLETTAIMLDSLSLWSGAWQQ